MMFNLGNVRLSKGLRFKPQMMGDSNLWPDQFPDPKALYKK